MSTSSVNGRLQGTFNQPHGIPQLDKDRKIKPDQLRINEANGIVGLDASVEIPTTLLKTNVANGVAGLDAGANLLLAQIPDTLTGKEVQTSKLIDMQDQSFTNLLKNGDFESWSAGASAAPDEWTVLNLGATSTIAREGTIVKRGSYSAKFTHIGVGDTLLRNEFVDDYYRGRIVTFGAWVYTSTANSAKLRIWDGISGSFSDFHTGDSVWQWMTVTRTIDENSTKVAGHLQIEINADVYIDGAILVEGSVCPAFSPHPTDQIPIVLTSAPTDAGANGETRWYAVAGAGGARRLYMSNGTDWKYIAIST